MVFKIQSRPKYTSQMASFRGLKDENFNLEISNRQQEKSVKQGYWEWRSIRAWKMEWSREGYR